MAFDKVIVLDDELIIRKALTEQLRSACKYTVAEATTIKEAESLLEKDNFDLIFLDVNLPDGKGTDLLKKFADLPEDAERPLCVVITGNGTVASAVDCMKMGAFDYIIKPFAIDEIKVILKKAESYRHLLRVSQYFSRNESCLGQEIIGKSPQILRLKKMINMVANTEATVLITGENGTGKELVAQEIHRIGKLSSSPCISVNCAAISESLIESEFFGHEKGAFTGAIQRRIGRFELANNGTILLDEIGELSPNLQAKLLRVLQQKEFERVGGNKTLSVNVRVLASTNRNLQQEVKNGAFREDLFYRLNVFPIEVPPLRERAEDIPLLANHFLELYSRKHGIKLNGISKNAMLALIQHDWPGNIRELQNTVERAVILSSPNTLIEPATLGILIKKQITLESESDLQTSENPINEVNDKVIAMPSFEEFKVGEFANNDFSLEVVERDHILKVLDSTKGNKSKAAKLLNINPKTLSNKLRQYNGKT